MWVFYEYQSIDSLVIVILYDIMMKQHPISKIDMKEYFSQQFHQKIDSLVLSLTSQNEKQKGDKIINKNLDIINSDSNRSFEADQVDFSNTFEYYVNMYLKNESQLDVQVSDLFGIVQNIVNKYKRQISSKRLEQINKQLYFLSKQNSDSRKQIQLQPGNYNQNFCTQDHYISQIRSLNSKIKELEEQLLYKSQIISQFQFKKFEAQFILREDTQDDNLGYDSNNHKLELNPEIVNEKELDLQTITEVEQQTEVDQPDTSDRTEFFDCKADQKIDGGIKSQRSSISSNIDSLIKLQQSIFLEQSQAHELIYQYPEVLVDSQKIQSSNLQRDYDSECWAHSIQVKNLKLEEQLSAKEKSNILQRQQIKILKREKDYYFNELKIKQSQLRKSNKIIFKILLGGSQSKSSFDK